MTTTTEVSDSLERVDSVINMLDEICDHMDGFSSAEEAWLSSITETLRTWRYVIRKPTKVRKKAKTTSIFVAAGSSRKDARMADVHCGFIWTSRC